MASPNKDNTNILSQIFISIEQHNIETENLFNELQQSKVNIDYNTIKLDDEINTKLKSINSAKNVTITNKAINIDRVVITPNLISGSNEPNVKLKKPIAVVKDVKKTGFPIFLSC